MPIVQDHIFIPISLKDHTFTGEGYRATIQALWALNQSLKMWRHEISKTLLCDMIRTLQAALPEDELLANGPSDHGEEKMEKELLRLVLALEHTLPLGSLLEKLQWPIAMIGDIEDEPKTRQMKAHPGQLKVLANKLGRTISKYTKNFINLIT